MLDARHVNILNLNSDDAFKSAAIYLSNFPACFQGNEHRWHQLKMRVASHFSIELASIKLAGSGHLGQSAFKKTPYNPQRSDLDLAIISSNLFSKYLSWVITSTNSFQNTSSFPRLRKGESGVESFKFYVSQRGMIRPDLLPAGKFKSEWMDFFNEIRTEYNDVCAELTAAIYLSEDCFIQKQIPTIRELRK